jgi:hypothetical protein
MKRIEVIQTFSHAGQMFHEGEVRLVTPEDAGYFCGLGWAKSSDHVTGALDLTPKTLEVQSGAIGHAATDVGV